MFNFKSVPASLFLLIFSATVQATTTTLSQVVNFSTFAIVDSSVKGIFLSDPLTDMDTVSFNRFDPTVGNLLSVELVVSGAAVLDAQALFRQDSLFGGTEGLIQSEDLKLTYNLSGFGLIQKIFPNPSNSCFAISSTTSASCIANIGLTSPIFQTNNSSSAGVLAEYIGPGTLSVAFNQLGNLLSNVNSVTGGYVDSRIGTFQTSGTLQVNYHYNVVPVPAAVWLFGSALLGLIGWQRRKHSA